MGKDELVQKIGTMLMEDPKIASRAWEHLVIVAQISPASIKVNGFAYQADGTAIPTSPSNSAVPDIFKALCDAMHEPAKAPWQACLVSIEHASGRLSIDFEYDDPKKWWIGPSTVKQMAETLRPHSR